MSRFVIVVLLALSCGAPTTFVGSCNVSSLGICTDYDGQSAGDAANLKMSCAVLGQAWSSIDHCSQASVVGGCHTTRSDSGTETAWYAPSSGDMASDVMSLCTTKNGTFVTP